jgi:hypothetical protein
MTLVYQAIHAALLPVRLYELPSFLGVFLDHIGHRHEEWRPKQTELFRAQCRPEPSGTGRGVPVSSPAASPLNTHVPLLPIRTLGKRY